MTAQTMCLTLNVKALYVSEMNDPINGCSHERLFMRKGSSCRGVRGVKRNVPSIG